MLAAGVGLCLGQPGAPPFRLQLTCLSDEWFFPGAVHVPRGACSSLEVGLASSRFKASDLSLSVNDHYLKHETKSTDGGFVLSAESRSLEDFLRAPETEIKAEAGTAAAVWRVSRWERSYIEVSSSHGGLPPSIRITAPMGPVVRAGSGVVVVAGSVSPSESVNVTLQKQPLARSADQPGFQFRGSVTLADDARDVVLTAVDDQGNSTTLVWPVRKL
ncbi:MAG: hypothetical protein C5B51_18015 [Terriglobia bacterium]|nr:MAG: hypothetical protein C5B51_18015 [Terriglobia bacterium]